MGRVFQTWDELVKDLESRRAGRKVVFTNGCFDILHVGHVRYLQEAKSLGDLLVVGLNTDASVQKLKGPSRPVQADAARAEVMAALGCVDAVVLFAEDTPDALIRKIKPDVLVKGGDYKIADIVGADFVLGYGGEVKALQFVPGYSTSSILRKI